MLHFRTYFFALNERRQSQNPIYFQQANKARVTLRDIKIGNIQIDTI